MRSFNLPCIIGSEMETFVAYLGAPAVKGNPLAAQIRWLKDYRNRTMPQEVIESFIRLREIAEENMVSYEELLDYAFAPENQNPSSKKQFTGLSLKDKVLDLSKLRKKVSEEKTAEKEVPKPPITKLRQFSKLLKQPPYSLLKGNYVDSMDYCLEMSHTLWPKDTRHTPAARALFLGFALSAIELDDPLVTDLTDVLKALIADDMMHKLAIIIDIGGGVLSPLCLGLLNHALDYPASFVHQTLQPFLRITLAEYAMTLRKARKTVLQKAVWLAVIHPDLKG